MMVMNPPGTNVMTWRDYLRIAIAHTMLYLFVVVYVLVGGIIFHYMEGEKESLLHEFQRAQVTALRQDAIARIALLSEEKDVEREIRYFIRNITTLRISLEAYSAFDDPLQIVPKRWTMQSSVLFSFTILTTIGYGNLVPTTYECQVFTMVYGAFGIPLFLITIADLGRFSKTAIMWVFTRFYKGELKKNDKNLLRELGEVFLVAVIFVGFIACGSAVLPLWENQLTYFDSVYFSYMSLTTIGLGDIVPRRMDMLTPTLIYITIGLWLTTALVEQLADVFRLVHYAGRQVTDVKKLSVWLGGHRLSVGGLISTVCRRVGMSDHLIDQINWDQSIQNLINGVRPQGVPIFPWHFADFVEHDPPLIDLSIDLDQMEYQGSFYCSRPHNQKPRRDSQMSAPVINWKRRLDAELLNDD